MGDPDLSEFLQLSRPKRKVCTVGVALAALDQGQAAKLQAACDADSGVITTSAIVQWLAARGHTSNISAVTSHRRRTCTCHD